MDKIRTAVDASRTGIRMDKVTKVKDQRVVIGCNEIEEINRVTRRLQEVDSTLKVETIENKDPLIILEVLMRTRTY